MTVDNLAEELHLPNDAYTRLLHSFIQSLHGKSLNLIRSLKLLNYMENIVQCTRTTLVRMAERSKALRSGRSPVLRAWVQIPLLRNLYVKTTSFIVKA